MEKMAESFCAGENFHLHRRFIKLPQIAVQSGNHFTLPGNWYPEISNKCAKCWFGQCQRLAENVLGKLFFFTIKIAVVCETDNNEPYSANVSLRIESAGMKPQ
jgi:hypothetical protein